MGVLLTVIGIVGVALVLLAYFLLQKGKLTPRDRAYPLMNIAGSLGIVVSLIEAWNLPSFIIQCCWIAISIYGMVRHRSV